MSEFTKPEGQQEKVTPEGWRRVGGEGTQLMVTTQKGKGFNWLSPDSPRYRDDRIALIRTQSHNEYAVAGDVVVDMVNNRASTYGSQVSPEHGDVFAIKVGEQFLSPGDEVEEIILQVSESSEDGVLESPALDQKLAKASELIRQEREKLDKKRRDLGSAATSPSRS